MRFAFLCGLLFFLLLPGCSSDQDSGAYNRGIYLLIDTSGTYTKELTKAQQIINYILAKLNSGDSFVVASIDTASFSEKDIISKITFDDRPSKANQQKAGHDHCNIWVTADTYAEALPSEWVLPENVHVYGGFADGDVSIADRDLASARTTLDAEGARRVLAMRSNSVIDGIIVTGGVGADGAGIYLETSTISVRISNCSIT